MPAINDLGQRTDNVRLKLKVHGQVGVRPVSKHAHPHKIGLLGLDLLARIVTALLSELGCSHLVARLTHFLFNIELNGQAVAVPARDIGGIKARQRLGLDDDVFKDLVDGMPNVELTVGIGGTVVEDKGRFTLPRFTHLAIQVHRSPSLKTLGLAL